MFFAFSLFYLISGKSPLQAEFFFCLQIFWLKLQQKLAPPQTKNPRYIPGNRPYSAINRLHQVQTGLHHVGPVDGVVHDMTLSV